MLRPNLPVITFVVGNAYKKVDQGYRGDDGSKQVRSRGGGGGSNEKMSGGLFGKFELNSKNVTNLGVAKDTYLSFLFIPLHP